MVEEKLKNMLDYIEAYKDVRIRKTLFIEAVKEGRTDFIDYLLENNLLDGVQMAFHKACSLGKLEVLEKMESIELKNIKINFPNYTNPDFVCIRNFSKGINLASKNGHTDVIEYLVKKGYNSNTDFLFSEDRDLAKRMLHFSGENARKMAENYDKIFYHTCSS